MLDSLEHLLGSAALPRPPDSLRASRSRLSILATSRERLCLG
jgi:hypothetical protein